MSIVPKCMSAVCVCVMFEIYTVKILLVVMKWKCGGMGADVCACVRVCLCVKKKQRKNSIQTTLCDHVFVLLAL
jgi:hypothetical protein